MESIQNIKKRLQSIHNINQITKAMELVAATKMRKSQEIALATRPYAYAVLNLLARLSEQKEIKLPPLMEKRSIQNTLYLIVSSDKGLAGSFNSAVFRAFEKFAIKEDPATIAVVGEKAYQYAQKRNLKVVKKFIHFGDFTSPEETKPLADFLISGYLEKHWDRVIIFSMSFKSALRQEVLIRQIFPIDLNEIKKTIEEIIPETGKFAELATESRTLRTESTQEYLIEPSPELVLRDLIPHLIAMQMYHLILEANASEHAARRLAMKNASDNARDLAEQLQLLYNKSRQAAITNEIIETTVAAESLL